MIFQISDSPAEAVAMIASHNSALHKAADFMKKRNVALMLNDSQFGKNLIPKFDSVILTNANVETSLAVYESCNPVGTQTYV